MDTAAAQPDSAPQAPDWAAIDREIACPLCEYNLRGLVEPRCPECGHHFVWEELLDEQRWQHAWLFEHRRERKARSFVRTFLHSQSPTSFWTAVKPVHRPKLRKLIVYWLILAIPPLLAAMTMIVAPRVKPYLDLRANRSAFIVMYSSFPPDHPALVNALKTNGSLDAAAAAVYPTPRDMDPLTVLGKCRLSVPLRVALVAVIWPWIAALSFIVFRDTLRQATIKSMHVVRCAVYSADIGLILSLPLLAIFWWRRDDFTPLADQLVFWYLPFDRLVFWCVLAWMALLSYRLVQAYRLYLGFEHPVLVVVWSQLIFFVLLCVATPG